MGDQERVGDQEGVEYMDKFFVRQKGHGKQFFQELVQRNHASPLIWRTDAVLAERFYGRCPGVRTLARHGEYVYQCVRSPVLGLTGSVVALTRIPSAF